MQNYRLSPTSLSLFLECPRCFWLKIKKGIGRPEQPASTLPRGMDLLIKKYFDKWRLYKSPPELKGKIPGELIQDQELLNTWRNWRTGLQYIDKSLDNSIMFGALDECFVDRGVYMPVDYKTRGFGLKDDSIKYFQNQLNCYTFLLKMNNFKVNNRGYLIYYILESVEEGGISKFKVDLIEMKTYPDDAYNAFKKSVVVLNNALPDLNSDCPFCTWVQNQK